MFIVYLPVSGTVPSRKYRISGLFCPGSAFYGPAGRRLNILFPISARSPGKTFDFSFCYAILLYECIQKIVYGEVYDTFSQDIAPQGRICP